MGKSSSPPPAPDYKGAIEAGRTNTVTPFGNTTWGMQGGTPATEGRYESRPFAATPGYVEPGTGAWRAGTPGGTRQVWVPGSPAQGGTPTQTTTLSPPLQSAVDSASSNLSTGLARPFDFNSVNDIYNKSYDAQTQRLDPEWQQREAQERTRLAGQGLTAGGEAYTNAMRDFNQARNDAYSQARLGAIATMPQTYQLAEANYAQPINTFNALRTGTQIQGAPNDPSAMNAAIAGGQYNQGLYNAQVGQQNALTSGLFGLGSAGLMAAMLSDIRLKRDIEKLGDDPRGWGIYRFKYLDSDTEHVGVMAQEVEKLRPDAVLMIDGYRHVNYGALYG